MRSTLALVGGETVPERGLKNATQREAVGSVGLSVSAQAGAPSAAADVGYCGHECLFMPFYASPSA